MKNRIQNILKSLNEGVYEKETELGLSLLTALAGQSILLLGPPGVAKSMVARRLKLAFAHARSFEYLMSRFSTPDEIFGPVSISRLKESDRYERCLDGYLPSADVVFLDEIWKAGPAIQNTLLTAINEKTYLNGQTQVHLPLKLLIGASNELPTEGEGLEALWDRFIVRLVSKPIENEANFYSLMQSQPQVSLADKEQDAAVDGAFTAEEYEELQRQIDQVTIPEQVLRAITAIRQALKDVAIEGQDVHRTIYVSDRRWVRIARLLRTSALLHDRQEVNLADLQLIVHALWNEPDELPAVCRIVADAVFVNYQKSLDQMTSEIGRAMKRRQVKESLEMAHSRGDHRDDDLLIYDGFYYGIDDRSMSTQTSGVPNTFIYVTDFRSMSTHTANEPAVRGVMYNDPSCPRRRIIRAYTNPDNIGVSGVELTRVNIYRDSSSIYINGVRYAMRRGMKGGRLEVASGLEPISNAPQMSLEDYESAVDNLFVEAASLQPQLLNHLFVSADVSRTIVSYMDGFKKQVAQVRANVRKLLYDE